MSNNTVLILIAVVVGVGILAAIAYCVVRFMRGSIKLSLPRTTFNPGDTIAGSFELNAKKSIEGNRLIVTLIGVQVTKTRKNGKNRRNSREIYRDEFLVEEAKTYPAGHTEKYEFKLAAPDTRAPEFMNSAIGQTLGTALSLLGNRRTYLKLKLEARLDAKGIDLATSAPVSVNMPGLL